VTAENADEFALRRAHATAPVLLQAQSIAIVGASPDDNKLGGKPVRFLQDFGFRGRVYPVNPKYLQIRGLRCYPGLLAIEDEIDIVVCAVPERQVLAVIEECISKRVKQVIVFSSGFAETGAIGAERQRALIEAIAGKPLRLVGPNTLGVANIAEGMIANFSQGFELAPGVVKSGPVAFASQSGAFGTFIFALAAEQGIGFKYFSVTGNEADVTVTEFIEAMALDPDIDVVASYIEGIRDGRRFLAVAEGVRALGKPLVVIKTGRTLGGSEAAMSHTAAIAGADEVCDAAFRQTGVIRVNDEEEMLDVLITMRSAKPMSGRRVGVATMSGGAGVLIADALASYGLQLAALAPETQQTLKDVIPVFGSTRNPVDLTAHFLSDPSMLRRTLHCLLEDPGTDAVLFFLGLGRRYGAQIAEIVREAAGSTRKPLVVAWTAGPAAEIAQLREQGIPVLPSPTRSVRALAALARFGEFCRRRPRSFALPEVDAQRLKARTRSGHFSEIEAKTLLKVYGLAVPPEELAASEEEAAAIAAHIGYPVALKICSPELIHKTEAGGVMLGVPNEHALRTAYQTILRSAQAYAPGLHADGVLVTPMAPDGIEVIIGGRRDPVFGPMVMVGSGGLYTELVRDVTIRVLPLAEGEAGDMVRELRVYPVFTGARGHSEADLDSLANSVEIVSRLLVEHPEVIEVEINPLRVFGKGRGAWALDAVLKVSSTTRA
jgi:acetate---CoA ligase (ADP-forming)